MECERVGFIVPNLKIAIWRGKGKDCRLIDERATHNLWLDSGLEEIRDMILFPGYLRAAGLDYMALGTSGSESSHEMTSLVYEVYRKQIIRRGEELPGKGYLQIYLDTDEANGNDLREASLCYLPYGGISVARAVFPVIHKADDISVTFSWWFKTVNAS